MVFFLLIFYPQLMRKLIFFKLEPLEASHKSIMWLRARLLLAIWMSSSLGWFGLISDEGIYFYFSLWSERVLVLLFWLLIYFWSEFLALLSYFCRRLMMLVEPFLDAMCIKVLPSLSFNSKTFRIASSYAFWNYLLISANFFGGIASSMLVSTSSKSLASIFLFYSKYWLISLHVWRIKLSRSRW